jgi:SOS-response transcriptional repressor LexA
MVQLLGVRSTYGANGHLVALERKGLILRAPGPSRAITIAEVGREALA